MAESSLRKRCNRALNNYRKHAFSVENTAVKGTPDTNYLDGWIEYKTADEWPVRPATPLRLKHPLTKEQAAWLFKRRLRGGRAYVVIRVGRLEHILLDGSVAAEILGTANKETVIRRALRYWPKGLDEEEFVRCVSRT